jgi:hypothetical protein
MPNIYKVFTKAELENKGTYEASTDQKSKVATTISNFVTYFKAKHLG